MPCGPRTLCWTSWGNYIGGRLASFYDTMPLSTLFGLVAAFGIGAGVVLALLAKPITRLEGAPR